MTKILINRARALQQVFRNQAKCKNKGKCDDKCGILKSKVTLYRDLKDNVLDPDCFFFGTSTSATQVEAFNDDSLQQFFAVLQGLGLPFVPAGVADDFQNRYPGDLANARSIKNNAFSFSIEWSRVEPQPGVFDQTQINYYINLTKTAINNGLEPFVQLHHFDYPLWIQTAFDFSHGLGAVGNDYIVEQWKIFVKRMVTELKPYVKYWEPIIEPGVDVVFAANFTFAPFNNDNFIAAYLHLIQMHAIAYHIIKDIYQDKKSIVIANINSIHAFPEDPTSVDNINSTTWANYLNQQLFLDAWVYGVVTPDINNFIIVPEVAKTVDLIDVHEYGPVIVSTTGGVPLPAPLNELTRLYISPFMNVVRATYLQYRLPIIVGENGFPEPNNPEDPNQRCPDSNIRPQYTLQLLSYIQNLRIEGIPIIGYLHWSLIDNWEFGSFAPRFGLYFVDRTPANNPTLDRSPKTRSINAYVSAILQGKITPGLIDAFPYFIP